MAELIKSNLAVAFMAWQILQWSDWLRVWCSHSALRLIRLDLVEEFVWMGLDAWLRLRLSSSAITKFDLLHWDVLPWLSVRVALDIDWISTLDWLNIWVNWDIRLFQQLFVFQWKLIFRNREVEVDDIDGMLVYWTALYSFHHWQVKVHRHRARVFMQLRNFHYFQV